MKAKDALAQCRQTIKSHPKQVAAIAAITVVAVALSARFACAGADSNDAVGEVRLIPQVKQVMTAH